MDSDGTTRMLSSYDKLISKRDDSLGWTIFLINDPEPEHRYPIQLNHLKQAARWLTPNEYTQEILVERNINELCGYPACSNHHEKGSKLNRKKIRSIHHKFNSSKQEQEPKFCSDECQDRSDYYLNSVLKKISTSSAFLQFNNNTRLINDDNQTDCINDDDEIFSLEELNQQPQLVEDSNDDGHQHPTLQLEKSSLTQKKYDHDFLQPILAQFQSSLQLNNKNIDHNLNPIFSSIKIIEHAPKPSSSSSSDPLHSSTHINKLEHQVLNHCSTSQTSSSRTKDSKSFTRVHTDLQSSHNPIHELSASLTDALNSNVVLSNSNSGTYIKRRMASGTGFQTPLSSDQPHSDLSASMEPGPGLLAAEIIYNVGSLEDQFAIDQALALRDQLNLNSTADT